MGISVVPSGITSALPVEAGAVVVDVEAAGVAVDGVVVVDVDGAVVVVVGVVVVFAVAAGVVAAGAVVVVDVVGVVVDGVVSGAVVLCSACCSCSAIAAFAVAMAVSIFAISSAVALPLLAFSSSACISCICACNAANAASAGSSFLVQATAALRISIPAITGISFLIMINLSLRRVSDDFSRTPLQRNGDCTSLKLIFEKALPEGCFLKRRKRIGVILLNCHRLRFAEPFGWSRR
jgi:hypothetical protein